ncbi:MAG: prolyl oligopeptidase family serine peptidase [Anaerolineae bacterium]
MPGPDPRLTIDQILAIRPAVNLEPPQWFPDGGSLAFVSTLGGAQDIWRIGREGGFPQRLTSEMGVVRFLGTPNARLSPDGQSLAYLSEKGGTAEIWLWSAADGQSRQLTRHGGNNLNAFSWSPDGRSIVFSGNRYGAFDIYRVDVTDGHTRRLTWGAQNDVYPVFTPADDRIVYVRLDERWAAHEIVVVEGDGSNAMLLARDEDLFDYHYGKTFGYPLVAPDGRSVLFRSHRNNWINYWRVSIDGGEPQPLCAAEADQSEAQWSPDGSHVAFIANYNGTLALCVVEADGGSLRRLVEPAQGVCAYPQWSPDGQAIAYLFQSPTEPLDLYVVTVADANARRLTNSMPGGNVGPRLAAPEKVVYPSFDGLPIPAYLYRPPAIAPGARLPAILWIHGGPTSQYIDAFTSYAQFFIGQGYVVLLPNIRGSSGYGKYFEDLNNSDWGHDDLKDVLAGADYLKTLDFVDPDHLGITGTSYGGCMSMSAVCWAPGAFQAAIPMSGYADWVHAYHEQELRHIKLLEYEFGPFETHEPVYRHCSPIHDARQAATPTFVIQGEGLLPKSEASRLFAAALEKEYKTVKFKAYPNEGYYVTSLAGTRQMWLDMLGWFDQYLRPM